MNGITRANLRNPVVCKACRQKAPGWVLSADSHRWCLTCALAVLHRFLQPPFVRGTWCPFEHAEWERNLAKEAAVA